MASSASFLTLFSVLHHVDNTLPELRMHVPCNDDQDDLYLYIMSS